MSTRGKLLSTIAAIITVILTVGITLTVSDNGDGTKTYRVGPDRSPSIGETTAVDTADPDNKPDTDLKLTESAENVAQSFVDNPKDLSNAGPVPLSGTGVQKNVGEVPFPQAADELDPCRTRFLKTNFSTRSVPLSQVVIFELHYTAGPDIPNSRSDVDGLTAFGNRASSRVSWHINMDKDGNCDYNVPFRLKAWTIANLNSYTINIEVAGRGESPYLRPAGYRALARIMEQVRRAYPGIKLRMAATDGNCHPTRGGIGTHWQGGPCSGGHSDIKPQDIAAVIQQIKLASGPQYPPITTKQRHKCQRLNEIRRAGHGKSPKAKRIRADQKKHHLKCINSRPGKLVRR